MPTFSLEKEPFPPAGGDDFYFSTPALTQRRDALCAAIEAGHVLLVDQAGSGKSTMLDDFAQSAAERWRVFRLSVDRPLSPRELVHALVSVFGLPTREPAAAALRDADALLELFTARSQLAVVLIDDAQRLERETLEQLLYLVRRWQGYRVRFLVCGEPLIMETFDSISGGELFPGTAARFDMPRFDREQVSDYLHLCLFRAGLKGDSPFDPAAVELVARRAEGLVGAIDPIARELLAAGAASERRPGAAGPLGMQTVSRHWLLALVAAAGLGVLLAAAAPVISPFRAPLRTAPLPGDFQSSIEVDAGRGRAVSAAGSASAESFSR